MKEVLETQDTRRAPSHIVEGVNLPRPFRIRRLGHFGYNVRDLDACLRFYRDLIGFRISDPIDFRKMIEDPAVNGLLGEQSGYFMRHGGDHHSFVLFDKRAMDARRRSDAAPEVMVNQITWQVNTLREVVDGERFLKNAGVPALRSGRDTPGSNWHAYGFDPDGHIIELYYGIEQIGWDGRSKPAAMYDRGFREAPPLPQIAEQEEVAAAIARGTDIGSGYTDLGQSEAGFDVGGILLPRPFAISGIGPLRLFVRDVAASRHFYEETLGLTVTETRSIAGHPAVFLRTAAEHHSLALYAIGLREALPVRQDSTTLSFGARLGSYAQLSAALGWLVAQGARAVALPADLSPGLRYNAFIADPEGHLIELYSEMDQLGWEGKARQPSLLPDAGFDQWPESIDPLETTFSGEPFLGPIL